MVPTASWKYVCNNKLNEEKDMCLILPSVELSQKHVFAVCSPAPFFCMMIQLTVDNVINMNKLLWTCFHRGLKAVWVLVFNGSEVGAHTDVFERLPQLAELPEAQFHHAAGPLVHPGVLVGSSSDGRFY